MRVQDGDSLSAMTEVTMDQLQLSQRNCA